MDELENILAIPREEVILASAKEGTGVAEILEAIVARIPRPKGDPAAAAPGPHLRQPLRPVQGRDRLRPARRGHAPGPRHDPAHGQRRRVRAARDRRLPAAARAGQAARPPARSATSRPGSRTSATPRSATRSRTPLGPPRRRCPATRRPRASSSRASTRSAARTTRSSATRSRSSTSTTPSFTYEPESSVALGFGFRCGFLGLLHMEIVQERLEREFDLDLIASAPSVEYHVVLTLGRGIRTVDNPSLLPALDEIEEIQEPWVKLSVVTPSQYIGPLMELSTNRRGSFDDMEYLDPTRVVLHFEMPLAELIVDYFDQLKSRSQGYASMDYEEIGYRAGAARQGRHPRQRRARGRPVAHRPSRPRPVDRSRAHRTTQAADPTPDVRDPDPGRDRQQCRREGIRPGHAQERAGQVLRWRHHPQDASCSRSRRKASSG